MKKIILILSALILTSCSLPSTDSLKNKIKNAGKNPCFDKATETMKVGCKK